MKEQSMIRNPKRFRRVMVSSALLAGVTLGGAGVASAATGSTATSSTSSSTSSSGAPTGTPPSGAPDPATLSHGPGETLLTGTELTQATAAAEAAEPGATVVRAETDSSGDATYEVHMKKSDGTYVTVELDAAFKVTGTENGFGPGPAGGKGPTGGKGPIGTPPAGGKAPTGTPPAGGKAPTGTPPTAPNSSSTASAAA
jgi:hypothetical protein